MFARKIHVELLERRRGAGLSGGVVGQFLHEKLYGAQRL